MDGTLLPAALVLGCLAVLLLEFCVHTSYDTVRERDTPNKNHDMMTSTTSKT
jgi:hypothetical protein